MATNQTPAHPASRRYTDDQKAQAVRLVRQLRAELGTEDGVVSRVARELGYGTESVRAWVKQADIDQRIKPGTTTADAERIKQLEQEVRELKRPMIYCVGRRFFSRRSSTAHRNDRPLYRRQRRRARGRAHL